jgi:hypothetical protein
MILEKSVTGTTQYFLVSVTVDAQNAYGAMLRGSYIVVLNFRDNSYDAYSNPTFCVSSYDGEEPTEEEKKIFKTMNGWPKLADSATQPTTTPE